MSADAHAFLEQWHRIVVAKDLDALGTVMADDMTLGAPPYWNKLEGKDLIQYLLGVILDVIEDFTYHREFVSGNELALEFRGHVGEDQLQGIDLITLDADGRVKNLDVLIRPLNTLTVVRDRVAPRMKQYLESLAS